MREIKFRHWSKEAGMSLPFTFGDCDFIAGLPYHDEPSVIMQSTGLHDKNGVEIFEGDIVRVGKPRSKFDEDIAKAVYKNGCFLLKSVDFEDETCEPFRRDYGCHGWYTVIGNIYENPELLGGEK